MIYTVTINPSVDCLMEVENFHLGKTNRASTQKMVPGGKGINVSRVLKNLGTRSEALGFIGGFTGAFIKDELEKESVFSSFIETEGNTRINVKMKTDTETEINGKAQEISNEHIQKLLIQLDELKSEDLLILSGSLPSTLPADLYNTIINRLNEKNIYVCVDTSGEPLKAAMKASPYMIKPNQAELEQLYEENVKNLDDAVKLARKAMADGARHVLVSMGGEGAALVTKNESYKAAVPKGTLINSVGAGDSMVAGFIHILTQSGSLEEAFKYSVAAGSATAFSNGFCSAEDVEKLLPEVLIEKV
ncbi:1-phosphofructokinase [Salipaludibacillus aurantiacus]|uniref:Tagatose-6-phosphate kinase n=1 Tax=Salipaludibacillus aurantiacus TaxID=1601833 RepID=A0A1H9WJD9_9BACI|nr:1-phosphofructokinase [Salipaludibacillus aurantiacus]SES33995.1 1-phosphofructokinase [Salipaludibacillus aurantiacus]